MITVCKPAMINFLMIAKERRTYAQFTYERTPKILDGSLQPLS